MSNKVIVEVEMLDSKKSLNNLDQGGKRLNKTLERTQQLMSGTKGGGGTRSAAAAFQQTEYGTARGTIGTGASGRDFAKQSRELDGLVRLYAVYAANVFAAGAAFRALSDAMDTTNMIAGLNQLGAASGVAMGGLAKRFSEASGGAISLRESMEATAKAVSSGLSQAQFLKLGEVAKRASQALGVNMSDAVSRLTRGITKLEPELLDELGIFTKVGKATEDYARAIGKPVSALTDFERRQAFANAVLEEGAKKFGQIELDTNPYDRLLATLKNVAQAGLEIVNNVLGPFAKLLANNTGLLVGALALIGAKIVKDALPAIGQWRSGLKDAADEARKRSSDIAASFGEGFVERTNAAFKVPQLEANLKKSEDAYRASRIKMAQMDTDLSKKLLKGGAGTDDKSLRAEQTRYSKEINALRRQGLDINNAQILALQKERAVVIALRADMKALNVAQEAALNKASGGSIFERVGDFLRSSSAKGARDKATRLDILENVSRNQREQGFGPAIGLMMKDLDLLPGKFQKVRTGIAGIVIAGAGSIGTAISGLSRFLGPVGIGLSVLTAALPLFRSNEEAAARFSSSLDLLKENSENSFRVLERLSKLDPLERISVDNIFAKATALESLGTSLSKAFADIETEIKGRNLADSTTNFLASLIGRSSEQLLAKQVGNTVERAVKLSANGPNGKAIQQELANLLKLPANATTAAITDALNKANPAIREAAAKIIEDSGKKAVASAGSLKTFKQGLAESAKVYQDLINTTKNSNPLSKFAEDSSKQIIELSKSLDNADLPEKLTTLRDLSADVNFLQLFPVEAARNILSTSTELNNLSAALADVEFRQNLYNDALNTHQITLDKYAGKDPSTVSNLFGAYDELTSAIKSVEQLNKQLGELQTTRGNITTGLQSASMKFNDSMKAGLIANIDIFTRGLVDAAARARLEVQKVAGGGINDPVLRAKFQANLDLKAVALDQEMLKSQMSLITSNADLRLAIMENTFAQGLAREGLSSGEGGEGELRAKLVLNPAFKGLNEQLKAIDAIKDNRKKSIKDLQKELKPGFNAGMDSGTIAGVSDLLSTAQAKEALKAQMATNAGKAEGIKLQEKLNIIDGQKTKNLDIVAKMQKDLDQEQLKFAEQKDSMSDADFKAAEKELLIRRADLANAARLIEANVGLAKSQAVANTLNKENSALREQDLEYTNQIFQKTVEQSNLERDLTVSGVQRTANIAKAVEDKNKELKVADQLAVQNAASIDLQLSNNKIQQEQLTAKEQLSLIDSNSFKIQMDTLKVNEARLEQTKQLTAAQVAYNQEIGKLELVRIEAGGTLTGEKLEADKAERARLLENLKAQRSAILLVTDAQIKSAEVQKDTTNRQIAYTDLFKQAFKGMEDAIVNFTKTGKLSFKDMINSFIEGLLRYEIQQQQIALFKGVGGAGGLGNILMNALGFGTPTTPMNFFDPRGGAQAKGNVYDTGLQTFARGGAFTNSIVSSPTLFKFAQGAGLMGEAGPEAIMPLKRDSNGNLGVRAGGTGGNVDVVVNNYGSEKAETRETTDSRGNRKVEVIIGDMAASEIARNGSASQKAIRGTFGLQPQLIRR
jgi:lambda family phage tail tape measure protein